MAKTVDREYYTIAAAARLLGVNRARVWRWVRAGRLPARRVGPHSIRIRRRDLSIVLPPVSRSSFMTAEAARRDPGAQLAPDEKWAAIRKELLEPPTPEELARRRAAIEAILARWDERPSISPMTSADLVHLSRDRDFWYGSEH